MTTSTPHCHTKKRLMEAVGAHTLCSCGYMQDGELYFYIKDYQGNVRVVLNQANQPVEVNIYYPYGGLMSATTTEGIQPYKYSTKELDRENGLDLYDSQARFYDSMIGRTPTQDPLAEKYSGVSPYLWCAGNPIRFIDPLGESTNVVPIGNDSYRVQSVNLDDNDKNIYVTKNGKQQIIGVTPSLTTFYASGKNGKGGHVVKSVINFRDNSGMAFKRCVISNPDLAMYVSDWGRSGHRWDFKNVGNFKKSTEYQYRGMPIGKDDTGKTIITSARDLGNWAAGYIAGVNGVSWANSRLVFDLYEMISNQRIGVEETSTINAEFLGWQDGNSVWRQNLPNWPVPIDW